MKQINKSGDTWERGQLVQTSRTFKPISHKLQPINQPRCSSCATVVSRQVYWPSPAGSLIVHQDSNHCLPELCVSFFLFRLFRSPQEETFPLWDLWFQSRDAARQDSHVYLHNFPALSTKTTSSPVPAGFLTRQSGASVSDL